MKIVGAGWIPYCIGGGLGSDVCLGPWLKWFEFSKRACQKSVRENAVGFKFKFIQVFIYAALRSKEDKR